MTTTTSTTRTTATTTTTMIRMKMDKCEIYTACLILYRLYDMLRINRIYIYFLLVHKCTSQLCMFHWGFTFRKGTFHKCTFHKCIYICYGHSFKFLQICEHIWWPLFCISSKVWTYLMATVSRCRRKITFDNKSLYNHFLHVDAKDFKAIWGGRFERADKS